MGNTLEPIKRVGFQQPDRQAVEDAIIKAVEDDPERFLRAYVADERSYGGRYICADLFKEQFPAFNESKESRNRYNTPVHNAAAVLSSEQFRRTVAADDSDSRRDKAVFLTGIPGAGKTTSILEGRKFPSDYRALFEGQISRPDPTIAKMRQALEAGLQPLVVVVHVRPEDALERTLKRFNEYGRGASINVMAEIQGGLPDGLRKIREHFGDKVGLCIYDYRNREHPQLLNGWKHLDLLRSEGDQHHVKHRLEKALEQQHTRISEAAYQQARGNASFGLVSGRAVDGGRDGGIQENVPRRGVPEGDCQTAILDSGAVAPRHDLNKNQAQMHTVATERVAENAAALKANPAFAGHSPEALEKLAYYRGIVQEDVKRETPEAQQAALARFDKAAQDPAFLTRVEQAEQQGQKQATQERAEPRQQEQGRKDEPEQSR